MWGGEVVWTMVRVHQKKSKRSGPRAENWVMDKRYGAPALFSKGAENRT